MAWIILVAILSGCGRAYIPLQVIVIDNGRPLSNVEVRPNYAYFLDPFHPDDSPRKTNVDGIAMVPLAVDVKAKSAGEHGCGYHGLRIENPYGIWLWDQYDAESIMGEMILLPTNDQVKAALDRAGGYARRVPPMPVIVNVLTSEEWHKKYSK